MERACWGLMGNIDAKPHEQRYEELTDTAQLHQTIVAFIDEYNTVHKTPLNLVTFKYVLVILYTSFFLSNRQLIIFR